jgi:hypothetical protein
MEVRWSLLLHKRRLMAVLPLQTKVDKHTGNANSGSSDPQCPQTAKDLPGTKAVNKHIQQSSA